MTLLRTFDIQKWNVCCVNFNVPEAIFGRKIDELSISKLF